MELGKRIPARIKAKAEDLIEKLPSASYASLGGKRLTVRENGMVRISFPVTRDYRLICLFDGSSCKPKELLTHQAYNKLYCL